MARNASVDNETLIADLGVRGVWETQAMALFDIRVIDTDARSYLFHSAGAILASAEVEKDQKYCHACHECCSTFTSLCFLVDGR